jgi:hypothetical protein
MPSLHDGPTPSPIPLPDRSNGAVELAPEEAPTLETGSRVRGFPQPKLRLKIQDLAHPGAVAFLGAVDASQVLSTAVNNVLRLLYRAPADPYTTVPPTRSVTLVLRDLPGVAYTTGVRADPDDQRFLESMLT